MFSLIVKRATSYHLSRQSGVVMIMTVIALVALIGVTGLVLDGGHMLLTKTRLQNIADAVALSTARTLDQTSDTTQATNDGIATFLLNANTDENKEILSAYTDDNNLLTIEYSNTLWPSFDSTSTPPKYVRVKIANVELPLWLIQVTGASRKGASASAVAAISPALTQRICNIAPVMMCGDSQATSDANHSTDKDDWLFGYHKLNAAVVKIGSNQDSAVGPGNFQLIRLPGGQGGNSVRHGTAGRYDPDFCLNPGEGVETEPGNTVGPVVQGFNTRFNQYSGPLNSTDYPPDFVTNAGTPELRLDGSGNIIFNNPESTVYKSEEETPLGFYYDTYFNVYKYGDDTHLPFNPLIHSGYNRRMLTVPVGDCSTTTNGQGTVSTFGFVCMFLIQPVIQQGNEAHVFAQVVSGCDNTGTFVPNPVANTSLPTKIILYKDPDNTDA